MFKVILFSSQAWVVEALVKFTPPSHHLHFKVIVKKGVEQKDSLFIIFPLWANFMSISANRKKKAKSTRKVEAVAVRNEKFSKSMSAAKSKSKDK